MKIEKLKAISYCELQRNFISKIGQINSIDDKKYVIKDGKIYKKYFQMEDPQQYTKSRNYNRLLKNIIKSKNKINKLHKQSTNVYDFDYFKKSKTEGTSLFVNQTQTKLTSQGTNQNSKKQGATSKLKMLDLPTITHKKLQTTGFKLLSRDK